MSRRMNIVWVLLIAVLVATGVMPRTAPAQKAAVPKPQDRLALAEYEVMRLLLLMEADKNGKISKQEYMRFMESEFARLDKRTTGNWTSRNSHYRSCG